MKKITYIVLIVAMSLNLYLLLVWEPKVSSVSCESQSVVYSYKTIYKIDKDQIEQNISDSEKKEIESIIEKLSIVDIEKIKQNFNKGDEDGVREAFKLMERRLSNDNYNRIKEISSEFINLNVIENI